MTHEAMDPGDVALKALRRQVTSLSVETLLADLVRIPTSDQEAGVIEYLTSRFTALGVPCDMTPVEGKTRGNLVVRWGEGPHSLVLNTHMDTVSPGEPALWTHGPHAGDIVADRLYGRGATDAKGSLAAMVAAFEAMVRGGSAINGSLILTAVACEETRGRGTQKEIAQGLQAEAAVVGEPTSLQVKVAHKGLVRFRITTIGRAAHASRPSEGVNAISAMAALIDDLDELAERVAVPSDALLGHASLAVTRIEGGEADNVVPERCTIGVDRRLLPGESVSQATAQIDLVVESVRRRFAGLQIKTEVTHDLRPAQTGADEAIVGFALRCCRDVTLGAATPAGFPACCDMVYLSEAGIPTVILGPGDLAQAHVVDEYVSLTQVRQAAEIYACLALRWLNR